MDVLKLYFIIRYGRSWIHKWVDHQNIKTLEEMPEQPIKGESYKEYRHRMDETSRTLRELKERLFGK